MTTIDKQCPACLRPIKDEQEYCEACEIKIARKKQQGGKERDAIQEVVGMITMLLDKAIISEYSKERYMFETYGVRLVDSDGNKRDPEFVAREMGEAIMRLNGEVQH